ncbi:hypothetical protein AaE_015586 [Aphanomyces astaci]|uniref:Uncharacterized protein n=1 Tax=Aphanomyces astaci TaxID=112090 RepID=A0A6A4Z294_APHAT|nr:hypothetical protein AaE_015586 [Aphanomyces astaci]
MQRQYLYAQGLAKDVIAEAQALRAEDFNSRLPEDRGERLQPGDEVWLFIDQVDAGVKKKLAHLWHGPFRIIKKISNYASQISRVSRRGGKNYRFHADVHDSRLKLRRQHESRPTELVEGVAPIAFDVKMILDDGDYDDTDNAGNPGNPVLPGNPGNVEEAPVPAVIAVPAANTSNPTTPKAITGIRDDRMIEHQTRPWQKQYEVQLEGSDQWVWVSEHAMPATPLLYEFERGRKNFDLLAEMVLGRELRVEPELPRVDDDEELATPELEIDPVPRDHAYEDEEKE